MNKKSALFLGCITVALCIILIAALMMQPIYRTQVIASAINFLKDTKEPDALLMLNVIYRRFGISEFADSLQRYDQMMVEDSLKSPVEMRLFRRIAVYNNTPQAGDLEAVSFDVDQVTVPALYCDQLGLPSDYATQLVKAATSGEYMLTHALLAWIWIQENGCEMQLPDGFVEDLYLANARLIDDDDVVTDLELDAAAFLFFAGQGVLVDDAFVERVMAVQNYDGGWLHNSDEPNVSDWYPSVLALMILLHAEYPSDPHPPMLAPPPT